MFIDIVSVYQFLAVVISWALAQLIKGFLGQFKIPKNTFFSTSGGMPSSHTSSAAAFFFSQLFFYGITSLTILSLVLLVLIMADAIGVRYATGINAKVLHKLTTKNKTLQNTIILRQGHKRVEVLAGFLFGLFVALGVFLII